MRWAKPVFALVLLFAAPRLATAQAAGRVAGAVTDSVTGQPVPGANVIVLGTRLGAVTGSDGRYTINGVSAGAHQIRVQRIGYAPVTWTVNVPANDAVTASVLIHTQSVQLDAVVSVGYGTQSRRDVTGSVATVTTEALEKAPIATIDQMLQGTSPGVQVTTASSEPGGALTVRIRGTSSITGNSEPLYVIDGFPIENDIEGSAAGNGGRDRTTPPNPLVTLNPSDIESISVLKDASATAIYGARGANGVVIITTKQGRGTQSDVHARFVHRLSRASRRSTTCSTRRSTWTTRTRSARTRARSSPPFPDSTKAAILASGINTDWQSAIFRDWRRAQPADRVRGATARRSRRATRSPAACFDQHGIVLGSGLKRLLGAREPRSVDR